MGTKSHGDGCFVFPVVQPGMEIISFSNDDTTKRDVGESLGTEHIAINHYQIPPGEGFPSGLHAHEQQEEVFFVRSGTATFETLSGLETVAAGEAIRFEPGEFQSGMNRGSSTLVVLALGAPKGAGRPLFPVDCQECDANVVRLTAAGGQFECLECGWEATPADCPTCGSDKIELTVTEPPETAVICRACGATFETPPLESS